MTDLMDSVLSFKEAFITLLVTMAIYYVVNWIMNKSAKGKTDWGIIRSITLFCVVLVGAIALILALPMEEATRGNISSLIGIVISAVFALSSATFMGNGLAGVMLRTINSYRAGDFIRTNEHFGRVTERGLFHTEIQTENRDLITIPNLYLATNPVRTTRSSGTFIASICSLGYDVNRVVIEKALIKATEVAGLKDGFVRITDLGDFSVVYKTFGLLEDVKTIITAESRLNACVLDALHAANIEIVSPNFMNQRPVGDTVFIPKKVNKVDQVEVDQTNAPENVIFDKADVAESLEERKQKVAEINKKIVGLKEALTVADSTEATEQLTVELEQLEDQQALLLDEIEVQSDEISGEK